MEAPGSEPGEKTLKQRIQELWQRKELESTGLNAGRAARSDDQRQQDALNWAFEQLPVSLLPQLPKGGAKRAPVGS